MRILIDGPLAGSYSLAVVNRELARELVLLGLDVFLTQRDGPDPLTDPFFQEEELFYGRYIVYSDIENHQFDVHSKNDWPVFDQPRQAPLLVCHCYAWEETTFPVDVIAKLENFDAILTASEFTSAALRSSGYTGFLACIDEGIDHIASPSEDLHKPAVPARQRTFNFLHISSGLPRKGMDSGIQAFVEEFAHDERVKLTIKTHYNPENNIYNAVKRLPEADKKKIDLIDRHLTTEQIRDLIVAADFCFFPSRGEGFLLPAAEAMYLGTPVCVTACGGNAGFCTSATSVLIPTQLVQSSSRISSGKSAWFESSIGDIRAGLRRSYAMKTGERAAMIDAARKQIAQFSWKRSARLMAETLTNLAKANTIPGAVRDFGLDRIDDVPVAVISTYNQKCGIATFSHALTDAFDRFGTPCTIISEAIEPSQIGSVNESNVTRVWKRDHHFARDIIAHVKKLPRHRIVIQHHPGIFGWDSLRDLVVGLAPLSHSVVLELHSTEGFDSALESLMLTIAESAHVVVHNGIDYLKVIQGARTSERFYLIPHAVETRTTTDAVVSKDEDAIKIFAFGLCGQHKQFEVIMKLVYYLKMHGRKVTATIVTSIDPKNSGSVVYGHNLWVYRQLLSLDDDVELIFDFLTLDQIVAIASSCSIAVFPYADVKEGASGAARVAMSAGVPVLVSDSSIFDDIRNVCQTCSVTDVGQLTDTMLAVLHDAPAARQRQAEYMNFATWEKHVLRLSRMIN